jgi:hypothetical protein
MEEYTKESETEIALTTQVTQVMSLESLKQREAEILQTLADYQSELQTIQKYIGQAETLGVVVDSGASLMLE